MDKRLPSDFCSSDQTNSDKQMSTFELCPRCEAEIKAFSENKNLKFVYYFCFVCREKNNTQYMVRHTQEEFFLNFYKEDMKTARKDIEKEIENCSLKIATFMSLPTYSTSPNLQAEVKEIEKTLRSAKQLLVLVNKHDSNKQNL